MPFGLLVEHCLNDLFEPMYRRLNLLIKQRKFCAHSLLSERAQLKLGKIESGAIN